MKTRVIILSVRELGYIEVQDLESLKNIPNIRTVNILGQVDAKEVFNIVKDLPILNKFDNTYVNNKSLAFLMEFNLCNGNKTCKG